MTLSDVEKVALRAGITEAEARTALFGGERGRQWIAPLHVRAVKETVQARAADGEPVEDDEWVVQGHSAVFDEPTLLYPWLRETVKRGAFKRVLSEDPDVRFLENHAGRPYARTSAGTLTLDEKPRGLFQRAVFDGRRKDAQDLWFTIERGDVSQQSFAFTIRKSELRSCECADQGNWSCDCIWERDINEIGELLDVGAVTYPAYPTTDVQVARGTSEQPGERDAQASDQEQRATASESDASPVPSGSDHDTAIRLRLIASKEKHHHVTGPQGTARSR